MKIKLACGEVLVGVKHDQRKIKIGKDRVINETVKEKDKTVVKPKLKEGHPVVISAKEAEQRYTEMKISLPDGKTLLAIVACNNKDQFSYAGGRYAALLKIFRDDTKEAIKKVTKGTTTKDQDKIKAKKHYIFSREDRTILFKAICKSFYTNDPVRVTSREKALLTKLKAKYEPANNQGAAQ